MADASFANLRVLGVEDEFLILLLIEDYLRELGCDVVGPAARLVAAQALVDQAGFDCALLDINIDGQKVYPIAAALAERSVPFAFLTGYDQADLADGFRDRPTLKKPFRVDDFRHVLRTLATTSNG